MLSQIPPSIQNSVIASLRQEAECEVILQSFIPSAGGCINHGGQLTTTLGTYFLKWNLQSRFPYMLELEAKGLDLLRNTGAVRVPEVLLTGTADEFQFVLMDLVRSGSRGENYWVELAAGLAALHKHSSISFGLEYDNYIGSLSQINFPTESWADFFVTNRLEPQLKMLVDSSKIETGLVRAIQALYTRLSEFFPEEVPALIHGDLWSGNLLVDEEGKPCLIDPAVYYGHREAELAFTQLFEGFEHPFYEAYQHLFPLEKGFEKRSEIYNLYPLLVHANLFGSSYLSEVNRITNHFR